MNENSFGGVELEEETELDDDLGDELSIDDDGIDDDMDVPTGEFEE